MNKLTKQQKEIVLKMRSGKQLGEYFFSDPIRYSVGSLTVRRDTFEKLEKMRLLQKIKPIGRASHHSYYTLTPLGMEIEL